MAKLVEIIWKDSQSVANMWMDADMPTIGTKRSCGYMIAKDKEKICLAQNMDDETGEVYNKFLILRGCIQSIRELK